MPSSHDIPALIEALKRLYSRLASRSLQKRLGSHQQNNEVATEHDIASPLHETIERLAADETDYQGPIPGAFLQGGPAAHQTNPRDRRRVGRPPPRSGRPFKELSRFLGRKKNGSALQPHVSHKLQASVWEHINTSLRLARRGDAKTARFHADVADNALKEAARYMSREEYGEFCAQVIQRLREIRNLTLGKL